MADPKWGLITSGATFEALVGTLVLFEDPKAQLFGRPGKDGGQDARSGDGLRAFQAKHHQDGSAAKAIADAKKEAAKIEEYRSGAEGPSRKQQWNGITQWCLVTNAAFNPTDIQRWQDEVVPLFTQQGLTPELWHKATLETLLVKHPEVARAFFDNEARAFLTLPEMRERLVQREPFLRRQKLAEFKGRQTEKAQFKQFLASDKLFFVIHGSGGIGKTRFMVEAGDEVSESDGWQVLWANVATLGVGTRWFDAIVPERRTVVLVDEPEDDKILRVLSEQLGGRAAKWKVVVTVRSPKDPVLRFVSDARVRPQVEELKLSALPPPDAEAMCLALLASGALASRSAEWRTNASKKLAATFNRHAVWMTLAVSLLEERGDLSKVPESAGQLADEYLDEIIQSQTGTEPNVIRESLRWLAILGTLNREDAAMLELFAKRTGINDVTDALAIIARLVARRALAQRGANERLVEVKPDVLRDHILLRWLSVDLGPTLHASKEAKALIREISDAIAGGGVSPIGRTILLSIARTELLLRLSGSPVPLLGAFYEAAHQALDTLPASARIALAEVAGSVAPFRVTDTVHLVRRLRETGVTTEEMKTFLGARTLAYEDVLLTLARPLGHAAPGAQTLDERVELLTELVEIAKAEHKIVEAGRSLPNDGGRATGMISQALEGGPSFWSTFDDAAEKVVNTNLQAFKTRAPSGPEVEAFLAVARPLMMIERHQTWFHDNAFTMRKYVITKAHPGWAIRNRVIEQTKSLLADRSVPVETHQLLWRLLGEAHRQSNYVSLQDNGDIKKAVREQHQAELEWVYETLRSRTIPIEEMREARHIWEWHVKYEKDENLKAVAARLDQLYLQNDLAAEFEPLAHWTSIEAHTAAATALADRILNAGAGAIEAFIDRGLQFFVDENRRYVLCEVANVLGSTALQQPAVRAFAEGVFAGTITGPFRREFALSTVWRWFDVTRKSVGPDESLALVNRLLALSVDDSTRIDLLLTFYKPLTLTVEQLTPAEHALLRGQGARFRTQGKSPQFVTLVAWTFTYEWEHCRALLEEVLDELTEPQTTQAVAQLINGTFAALYKREDVSPPSDFMPWLLEQLLRVANFDRLDTMTDWKLEELSKKRGLVPLAWLPKALKQRAAAEKENGRNEFQALSFGFALTDFVESITEEQAQSPETMTAVSQLLELLTDGGTVGYRLPDILNEVDPHGFVVPRAIAERIRTAQPADVGQFAHLAKSYVVNTPAWREIATAALSRTDVMRTKKEESALFSTISEPGVKSWNGQPGQVPVVFVHAVEEARNYRQQETDQRFAAFWDWFVDIVEAELRREEQHAKEERGE